MSAITGAAAGADRALKDMLRLRMEREAQEYEQRAREEALALRAQELEENRNWRQSQAEATAENRRLIQEERQMRIDEKTAEQKARTDRLSRAQMILDSPEMRDPEEIGRAKYIIEKGGEDLGDVALAKALGAIPDTSGYTPVTPEEWADREKQAALLNRYAIERAGDMPTRPRPSKYPDWDESKWGPAEFPTGVQRYVVALINNNDSYEEAMKELQENIEGVYQGNRHLDMRQVERALRLGFSGKRKAGGGIDFSKLTPEQLKKLTEE